MTITTEAIDAYQDSVEEIKDEYADRITVLLSATADLFTAAGWKASAPYEMFDEEFVWAMVVTPPDAKDEDSIEIAVEIAESLVYDRTLAGVNLGLRGIRWGGRIVAELQPYNFTPDVWVPLDDAEGIRERFEIILNEARPQDVLDFILENA